ncbi:RTA1-domain-containing protein [Atractiella rhizophila]|nr:RTA1-domain-containing protein [Atractiella rhizophila]
MSNANDNNTNQNDDFYNYNPNHVLPIVGAAIFGFCFLYHSWQSIRSRSYNYWWPFLIGVGLEIGGYVFRKLTAKRTDVNQTFFILQQVFIIIAPALLAASLYMSYGRLTLYVEARFSPMRPKWVTRTFVTFDVFSFLIQAAGGSLYSGDNITETKANIAKAIIVSGFVIQIVAFSSFLLISRVFLGRARAVNPQSNALKLVPVLWWTSIPILLRTVFRLIEFATANKEGNGYILDHEWFLWVFETTPVVISVLYIGYFHPSRYIPNDKSVREDKSALEESLPLDRV